MALHAGMGGMGMIPTQYDHHAVGPAIDELVADGVVPEAQVAFRAWKFIPECALGPMMKHDAKADWQPLGCTVQAVCRCMRKDGVVVKPENHLCGFYGFKRLATVTQEYRTGPALVGAVAFSGRVYEFEFGFRAERATVLGLLEDQPLMKDSAAWRCLPLPLFDAIGLCEYAAQFGYLYPQDDDA